MVSQLFSAYKMANFRIYTLNKRIYDRIYGFWKSRDLFLLLDLISKLIIPLADIYFNGPSVFWLTCHSYDSAYNFKSLAFGFVALSKKLSTLRTH
jgi:hypothetical protein